MAQLSKEIFPTVHQTEIKSVLTPETMSHLGRELLELAKEIEFSDMPEMSEEDIERELALRRGNSY